MCTERVWLAVVVLASTGCLPGPLEELGRKCTRERACGIGLACVDGVCIREGESGDGGGVGPKPDASGFDAGVDAGQPPVLDGGENLLLNPGFERLEAPDGKQRPAFWALEGAGSVGLTEQMPYEGKYAAQLSADFSVAQAPTLFQEVGASSVSTERLVWCAEAWVRLSGGLGVDAQGALSVRTSGGTNVPSESMTTRVRLNPTWQQLRVEYEPLNVGLGAQVRISAEKLMSNTAMLVDQVRLYRAPKACRP